MLRLLLDENIDPEIEHQLHTACPELPVASLHTWEERRYLQADDTAILVEAFRQGLTLVTYDTKTIVPLLKTWGEQGSDHGGVIFVKPSTIAPNNIGSLVRALALLWTRFGDADWTNGSIYLTP